MNKYKKPIIETTEEDLKEINRLGVTPVEYHYVIKKDILKFRYEMGKYIGAICRKFFPGFEQKKERYKELREDTFIFVLECLEGKHGEKYVYRRNIYNRKGILVVSKFPSYVQMLIRWNLSNYFRKFNKERKAEISLDGISNFSNTPFKENNSADMYCEKINEIVKQFQLDIDKNDLEAFIFYNSHLDDKEILNNIVNKYPFEFKLISWILFKKCRKEIILKNAI